MAAAIVTTSPTSETTTLLATTTTSKYTTTSNLLSPANGEPATPRADDHRRETKHDAGAAQRADHRDDAIATDYGRASTARADIKRAASPPTTASVGSSGR